MSDVREQLIETLKAMDYLLPDQQVADAILARFEVTPRPALSAERLGGLIGNWNCAPDDAAKGRCAYDTLESLGLTIVRIEEPTPTGRVG